MFKRFNTLTLAICAAWLVSGSPASAAATDALIEGAKLCTSHLSRYEREFGVPTHLLSAIASTESGRYDENLGIKVPWPWTINAEGKGYFFSSKEEAISAVHKLHSQGIQSIDVGCMQVNLMHHPQAFASLDQAFEPQTNIAYAASFLRNLYQEEGSWKKAAADYHSKTPTLGNQYVGLVYNSWYQIIDKLRAARMQVPEGTVVAMNDMKNEAAQDKAAPSAPLSLAQYQHGTKKLPTFHAQHMNSIQVSKSEPEQQSGIMVVSPEITATAAPAAPVTPIVVAQAPAASSETGGAHIIRVNADPSVVVTKKTGPNFIFND